MKSGVRFKVKIAREVIKGQKLNEIAFQYKAHPIK
jgi:hypothetical protein